MNTRRPYESRTVLLAARTALPFVLGTSLFVMAAVERSFGQTTAQTAAPAAIQSKAEATHLRMSGNISLGSRYSMGTPRSFGFDPAPWEYASNSRMTLQYGAARFSAAVNKPTVYMRSSQPDKHFTLDFSLPWAGVRYGDLTPQFTQTTTGFLRVTGAEGKLSIGRFAEINSLRGMTKRATPTAGYMIGSYAQHFTGHRLVLAPTTRVSLGLNAIKVSDDPTSVDLSQNFLKPTAKENLVLGTDFTFFFFERKGSFTAEYVASFYNADRSAPDTSGSPQNDSGTLDRIANRHAVRQFVTLNDSTRSGEAFAGRLVLPTSKTRLTLDYRRASPSFASLTTPYEPSDHERIRMNNNTTLFSGFVTTMFNGEFGRSNVSRRQPYTTHNVNLFTTVTLNSRRVARVTVGWRQNDRQNDAPAPAPKSWDRRIDSSTRAVSLSATKNLRFGATPVTTTGILTRSWYDDRIYARRNYGTSSIQLNGQTLSASRLFLMAQSGYAIKRRHHDGAQRHSVQLLVKEGYEVIPKVLHLYATEGFATERSSDETQKSNTWTWGAGAKWRPSPGTSIEAEWQSTRYLDFIYDASTSVQQFLELRLTHMF